MKKNITLKEIAYSLDIVCDDETLIIGLNTLEDANKNEISFLENKKYLNLLKTTKAKAVLITQEHKDNLPDNTIALVVKHPYICLANLSKMFAPPTIDIQCDEPILEKNVTIQQNVYLGNNSYIDKGTTIMSGAFIGDNVKIGQNCIIYPNVTIYRDCIIGDDTIIHAGTVIGSDGFGFATNSKGQHIKIYQNGNVKIGKNVEIGANCTIDRGAFSSTIIENLVRIDNLVHIAHNCIIGKGTIITGQCGIAGSTTLDEYVIMGAQSGIAGHLQIAPHTIISAKSGVTKSIKQPKKQWAGFPLMEHRTWLKLQAKISRLLKK
jgi:UDP-3-O-[3-hydroxymyristoyl] glucosamine N-acyltransferase